MAEVTIVIRDIDRGRVEVKATPNMEQIFKMADAGHELTSAHGYAFAALNTIRKQSKSNDPTNKIIIPRRGL